uniref:Uncharacterized protein n=1 Tax=Avena sativa TaxID=4498 RepID=A0ACD5Z8X6_AVESA
MYAHTGMAMDILAHREHLVSALHGVLGVAVLLACLFAEVLVFVMGPRAAALYLVPVSLMLLLLFQRRAAAGITTSTGLVDFSCVEPPRRLRVPVAKMLEHLRLLDCFDDGSVELMSRTIKASGMGDEAYLPPALHYIPPLATHDEAIREAHMLFFPALDDLFAKTGVLPSDVGALVVNCSGFCPAPSLAAIVANHYRMPSDVRTFNLSGMGCSAGAVAMDVASSLLRLHAATMSYAVVVSAEILTVGWYSGKEHAKLLLNCFFRSGCSAALVTTNGSSRVRGAVLVPKPIKYRLLSLTRTNQIADDRSYRSGYRDDDDEGITGFTIGRDVGRMFGAVLRAHLVTLGPSVLPWQEKLRYAAAMLLRSLHPRRRGQELRPDFRAAADHFCLPAAGEPIIVRMGQGLGLGEREMEAALATFRRFGNQSAASLWYQLAYLEAKGRVRKGDTVRQLAVGSGLADVILLFVLILSFNSLNF